MNAATHPSHPNRQARLCLLAAAAGRKIFWGALVAAVVVLLLLLGRLLRGHPGEPAA